MILFRNLLTGETLDHKDFVWFVWDEAERQFNDTHDDDCWENLTKDEQIYLYCEMYEHQLMDRDWTMCEQ